MDFGLAPTRVLKNGDDGGEHEAFDWSRQRIIAWAIGFIVVLAAISIAVGATVDRDELPRLVGWLQSFGERWWAPLALIGAFIVINLTGIPGTPLTLAAGAIWGWLGGGAWVMAGVVIGTAVPYIITRWGVPRLRRTIEKRFGWLSSRLRGHGFTNVALLRLAHVFPFAAISYAAGLADVKPRDYIGGTVAGTAPGVFVYTYLADSILRGVVSTQEATLRIAVAAVLMATFVVASRWIARRVKR